MGKWSDIATWRGPTVNCGDGDGALNEPADRLDEHRGIVVHIAAGYFEGTIAWQRNPASDVSSHFVVAKDGRVAQMVDTEIRAWTQRSGNRAWLSIENEGFLPDRLTPQQVEANAQLLARAHREYGIPLQVATSPAGRGLGHHSMGADWGHQQCPGPSIIAQKPAIVMRAQQIVSMEDGMAITADDIKAIAHAVNGYKFPADTGLALHTHARNADAHGVIIRAQLQAMAGRDWVDEEAIVGGVLAGLGARGIAEIRDALVAALGQERAVELGVALTAGP